jgi:hypothetical protein
MKSDRDLCRKEIEAVKIHMNDSLKNKDRCCLIIFTWYASKKLLCSITMSIEGKSLGLELQICLLVS